MFGPDGAAFSPTHTRKGDRLYRYYVSQTVLRHGAGSCPVGRVPAGDKLLRESVAASVEAAEAAAAQDASLGFELLGEGGGESAETETALRAEDGDGS